MTFVYLAGSSGMGSVLSGTTLGSLIQVERVKNKVALEKDKGDYQIYSSGNDLTKLVMNDYIKQRMPEKKTSKVKLNK
jgi:hypothetical protein